MKDSFNIPTLCFCGSGKNYFECCEPYFSILGIQNIKEGCKSETLLIAWSEKYSVPIIKSFRSKVDKYVFRASMYLDNFFNYYYPLGFTKECSKQDQMDEAVRAIKHNMLLTFFGALACLSQGLLLQSGTLLRSCLEDSFVLMDLFLNEGQVDKFLNNKYSTIGLLSRIKKYLPDYLSKWYGYFSANFAHFGPLHQAPYKPSACYADNYIIGSGTENIVLIISAVHLIFERIYFEKVEFPVFWRFDDEKHVYEFNSDNVISIFIHKLLEDLIADFPPDEKKEGYKYTERTYKTKL